MKKYTLTDLLGTGKRPGLGKSRVTKKDLSEVPTNRQVVYDKMTAKASCHGKCTDWIRENRRRRSAGLPQKRVLPFGLGIFDPIGRTVSKTLSDGVIEITNV